MTADSFLHVLSYMNAKDIGRIAQACQEWLKFSQTDAVWKQVCFNCYGNLPEYFNAQKRDWKATCKNITHLHQQSVQEPLQLGTSRTGNGISSFLPFILKNFFKKK
jgi:hypothetical protein